MRITLPGREDAKAVMSDLNGYRSHLTTVIKTEPDKGVELHSGN